MNKAASVKGQLRNLAQTQNRSFQEILQSYALERTIYRLSISPYDKYFTLKGGVFLYGLFSGNFPRSTADIDLLGHHISNEINTLKDIFSNIFAIICDDGLDFDLNSLEIHPIAVTKAYPGARLTIISYLERTKILVAIDIGFGDAPIPNKAKMDFPVLLNDPIPQVYVYSKESVIAEKLEAIVSLGNVNSRYKDFFDIYTLSQSFSFEGERLQKAIRETFTLRKTPFQPIVAFEEAFIHSPIHQKRWKAFIKKKNAQTEATLSEIISDISSFTHPVIQSIQKKETFRQIWDPREQKWKTPT